MNKTVVLVISLAAVILSAGCKAPSGETAAAPAGQDAARLQMKQYLGRVLGSSGFGGRVFCAYDTIASEQNGDTERRYLWAVCQEYYRTDGQLRPGTEVNMPVAVTLQNRGNDYRILGHDVPGGSGFYARNVDGVFPASLKHELHPAATDYGRYRERIRLLSEETRRDAETFFAAY